MSTTLSICVLSTFVLLNQVITVQVSNFSYQSYQGSVVCSTKHQPLYPLTLPDIQSIVRYANKNALPVKVLGNQHTVSDSICTTGLPVILHEIRHFSFTNDRYIAVVGAGMRIAELFERLNEHNRTISGPPVYGGVTVGGAIANAVHGTGLKFPVSISDQIVAITLVDGTGNIQHVSKNDKFFSALKSNLGLLGIIYEVEIETQPQHKVELYHVLKDDSILCNTSFIKTVAEQNDHFQLWWHPINKKVVLEIGNRVPVTQPGDCTARNEVSEISAGMVSFATELFQLTKNDIGVYLLQTISMYRMIKTLPMVEPPFAHRENDVTCINNKTITGYSHEILTSTCEACAWNSENWFPYKYDDAAFAIPMRYLKTAMNELQDILETHMLHTVNGIWIRFLTPGDALLAINKGSEPWVVIEWLTPKRWSSSTPKLGLAVSQLLGQVLIRKYAGRPHWAKNGMYYSSPTIIQNSHPGLQEFVAAMNFFDPGEIFLNDFGRRLKYGEETFTVTEDLQKHCAINELCICNQHQDCGSEGFLDYTCGQFPEYPGYNVCLPGILEQTNHVYVTRSFLNLCQTKNCIVLAVIISVLATFSVARGISVM